MGFITRIGWAAVLAVVMVLEGVPGADGAFQGDPVQTFKRMRFGDQRTVWSDVLVGQGPLFDVDRAVELHLPTADNFMETTAVKLQLSYDNEKHVSEWLTLSDGAGLMLDTLTVHFVHAGGAIKEIHHQQHFLKSPDGSHPPPTRKRSRSPTSGSRTRRRTRGAPSTSSLWAASSSPCLPSRGRSSTRKTSSAAGRCSCPSTRRGRGGRGPSSRTLSSTSPRRWRA
mmetsp:Transcript_33695/g.86319  ORF Transcript_33695/g.86319 Transcript_33695/m.86319 type:complete len:226 (+) Transcript_33695:34-711(+)